MRTLLQQTNNSPPAGVIFAHAFAYIQPKNENCPCLK